MLWLLDGDRWTAAVREGAVFLKRPQMWTYCRKMIKITYISNEKWKTGDKRLNEYNRGSA